MPRPAPTRPQHAAPVLARIRIRTRCVVFRPWSEASRTQCRRDNDTSPLAPAAHRAPDGIHDDDMRDGAMGALSGCTSRTCLLALLEPDL